MKESKFEIEEYHFMTIDEIKKKKKKNSENKVRI